MRSAGLIFLVMAEGAFAQLIGLPDVGVTIVGIPTAPVIVNGSSHRIVRYTLVEQASTGVGQPHSYDMIRQFIKDPDAGIAPGATFSEAQGLPTRTEVRGANGEPPPPPVQVSLDSILFENGLLVGPDRFNSFESIKGRLQAQRDISQAASAGNWSKLQQVAAAGDRDVLVACLKVIFTMKTTSYD